MSAKFSIKIKKNHDGSPGHSGVTVKPKNIDSKKVKIISLEPPSNP